jgi:LacI family transcriptional regulator
MHMPRDVDVTPGAAVGVRDIARRLGVSVGTIDRALHDKPGIKADTRARVLAAAAALGYRPNLAARYLRARHQPRVAVHLPEHPAFFWDTLRDGIREAAAPFAPPLELEFHTDPVPAPRGPAGLRRERTAGAIVASGTSGDTTALIDDFARRNIPIACVAGDGAESPLVLSVSVDPFAVGALAGELIGRFLPRGGEVAIVAGATATRAHTEQARGFASSLTSVSARLKLAAVLESHADAREADRRVRALLRAHPRLKGLYVSAPEALPVLRAVRDAGRLAALTVVTTDLVPEVFDWIRSGAVAATVYQRPLTQGHVVVRLLHQYLQTSVLPAPHRHLLAPYAVMSSNLDIVLQRLQIARDAARAQDDERMARQR